MDCIKLLKLVKEGRDDTKCRPTKADDKRMPAHARKLNTIGRTALLKDTDNHLFAALVKGINEDIKEEMKKVLEDLVAELSPPKA
ncbi:hypothetical protein HK104_009593 [Borealophlyctis nickersoniae]|nr:hypothetical protein HK104_009593 [Borealophlyctis nickersoniae]